MREAPRVVEVKGSKFGSGYLISPRLILTAWHVAQSNQNSGSEWPVEVRLLRDYLKGSGEERYRRQRARVLWPSGYQGTDLDFALLMTERQTDPDDLPVSWTQLPQFETQIVHAMGFPDYAIDKNSKRIGTTLQDAETILVKGTVNGGDRIKALSSGRGKFDIWVDASSSAPKTLADDWKGFSGAAVFTDRDLVGLVVKADKTDQSRYLLKSLPVDRLFRRDDVKSAVENSGLAMPHQRPLLAREEVEPVLRWSAREPLPAQDGLMARLLYVSQYDEFRGRSADLGLLKQFLGEKHLRRCPESFRWMLVTGPGGEGKSRLAFELVKDARNNGWHAGFLDPKELRELKPNTWRPRKPTMMVIDYVAQHAKEAHKLLLGFARNVLEFEESVRVLLLERKLLRSKSGNNWFDFIVPAGTAGQAIHDHAYSSWHLELQPIKSQFLARLMQDRIEKAKLKAPPDQQLVQAAQRMDPRSDGPHKLPPRPLFAAITAEALIAAMLDDSEAHSLDWGKALERLDRHRVLDDLIQRERFQFWRKETTDINVETQRLALHERLLALTTMCLGQLTYERVRLQCPSRAREYLPVLRRNDLFSMDEDRVRCMGGLTNGVLGALEPDVIGEHYVLRFMENEDIEQEERAAIFEAALCLEPKDAGPEYSAGVFIVLCVLDFPERAQIFAHLAGRLQHQLARDAFGRTQVNIAAWALTDISEPRLVQTVEGFLDAGCRLAEEYPNEGNLRELAAWAISNFCGKVEVGRAAPRIAWVKEILSDGHQEEPELRHRAAKATFNYLNVLLTSKHLDEAEHELAWLKNLASQLDDITCLVQAAKAVANFMLCVDLDRAAPELAWLKSIVQKHPEEKDLLHQAAYGALRFTFNVSDRKLAAKELAWLKELVNDPKKKDHVIRLTAAKAAANFNLFVTDYWQASKELTWLKRLVADHSAEDALRFHAARATAHLRRFAPTFDIEISREFRWLRKLADDHPEDMRFQEYVRKVFLRLT